LNPEVISRKNEVMPSGSRFRRRCFIVAGFISIAMGLLGIVLPVLPTTPFMLLGAYCFARGSEKWHHWLLNHRVFGEYITAFRERRGLTLKQKRRIALTVTLMMAISALHGLGPIMTVVIALIWVMTLIVLFVSPTASESIDLKATSNTVGGAL